MKTVSDIFGTLVFDDRQMKARLPHDVYISLKKTIDEGGSLNNEVANAVADAMTQKGYSFVSAQIEMVPQNYQKLTDPEQISLMEKLLDIMDDDDDVQNVWHNWDED